MSNEPQSLSDKFDLSDLITGLVGDLKALRAGSITVRDAQARAVLAKQILRGVHYVVIAQKFLEGRALPKPDSARAQPEKR
jgi:hypothetical protein